MTRKIKKINELFDNEDLYSHDEIRFITGELKNKISNMIKNGEIHDFKDIPDLGLMFKQVITSFPFLTQAIGRAILPEGMTFIFTDAPFSDNAFVVQLEGGEGLYNVRYGEVIEGEEHSHQKLGLNRKQLVEYIGKEVYPKFKDAVEDFKEQQGIDILHTDPTTYTSDPIFKDLKRPNFDPQFNSVVYNFDEYYEKLEESKQQDKDSQE